MALSVDQLARTNVERSQHNHETYKMLYTRCTEHIHRKHAAGCTEAVWNVPHFVMGRQLYDVHHAVRYIRDKLLLGKFGVEVHDTTLVITWGQSLKDALKKATRPTGPSSPPSKSSRQTKKEDEPLAKKLKRMQRRLQSVR